MKNIWSSVNPVCKSISKVHKIVVKQIVPVLFHFNSLFYLKVTLHTRDIVCWGLPTLHWDTDATYKQSLCFNDFFCSLPSEPVCIFPGGYRHTLCDFYRIFSATIIFYLPKILCMCRWYIFLLLIRPITILCPFFGTSNFGHPLIFRK